MPSLNLPQAIRYFFCPFVAFSYYCIYAPQPAGDLIKEFGAVPAVAFLVAGISIYYFYRYAIYDDVIMPLNDVLRKENQRIFIKSRYKLIDSSAVASTRMANRVIHELSDSEPYMKARDARERPMRAAAVHLLYQAFFCSAVFLVASFLFADWKRITIFLVLALTQLYSAIRIDASYDTEELIPLRSMVSELDKAAAKLGLTPQ